MLCQNGIDLINISNSAHLVDILLVLLHLGKMVTAAVIPQLDILSNILLLRSSVLSLVTTHIGVSGSLHSLLLLYLLQDDVIILLLRELVSGVATVTHVTLIWIWPDPR